MRAAWVIFYSVELGWQWRQHDHHWPAELCNSTAGGAARRPGMSTTGNNAGYLGDGLIIMAALGGNAVLQRLKEGTR